MTQLGHLLTGAAVGALGAGPGASRRKWAVRMGAFALLANVPDIPLPGWGHDRYDISHSVFVNGLAMVLLAAGIGVVPSLRRGAGALPAVAAGAAAWASHLLLDTFYNHGLGLAMFWPLSSARLALTVPWLGSYHVEQHPWAPPNLRVLGIELATYLPVLLTALCVRQRLVRGRAVNRSAGAGH